MLSALAALRDEIVHAVAPILTNASFAGRRGGRRFVRASGAGVVQVVEFPMAPYTKHHYGTFSVEPGIYLADVVEFYGQRRTTSPGYAECEVRPPFGELGPLGERATWSLDAETLTAVADEVAAHLEQRVFPYFATYSTRRALVDAVVTGRNPGFLPRAKLSCAVLLAAEGDVQPARQLLEQHLREEADPRHRSWLEEKLARSSLPLRD